MTKLNQLILCNWPWSENTQGEGDFFILIHIHRHKCGLHAVLARPPIEDQGNTIPKFNLDIKG